LVLAIYAYFATPRLKRRKREAEAEAKAVAEQTSPD
jgi:hypothetical protein